MSGRTVATASSRGVPRSSASSDTGETRETADPQLALIQSYLKQLRLPAIARDCVALAREAEQQGAGYLGYLQTLLAQEVAQRHDLPVASLLAASPVPL